MASKPKQIHINEMCSKCRPHTLGANKKMRQFETLFEEKEEVGGKELLDSKTIEDWTGSADEIEHGLKALTLTEAWPQSETKPALHATTENVKKIEDCEQMVEQPTDSEVDTPSDLQGRKERWVDVYPSVANGEPALSAKLSHRGLFSRIFRPFGKSEHVSEIEGAKEKKGWNDVKKEGDGGKTMEEGKGKDDPDCEVVSGEEKEEMLWKDEGEWVNVSFGPT